MTKKNSRQDMQAKDEAAKASAKLADMLRDIRLKVLLTTHNTTAQDTLAKLIFVLTLGTDLGIVYSLKDARTKLMHVAQRFVVLRCLDSHLWDETKSEMFIDALDYVMQAVKAHPQGLPQALTYAAHLATKALEGTLTLADTAEMTIHT